MKNPNISRLAYMAACVFLPLVALGAKWITKTSGEYSWTDPDNWSSGTLPTSSTVAQLGDANSVGSVDVNGHQIITGDGVASYLDVITAMPVTSSAVRTFAGNVTAKYGIFRSGTNEISGTLTLTGNAASTATIVGTSSSKAIISGELDIMSGGEVVVQGNHTIYVGRYPGDDNKGASGRVRVREGGRLMLAYGTSTTADSGLMLGVTSGSSTAPWFVSTYVQDGGYAHIDRFFAGGEVNANASMTVRGGVLDLEYADGGSRFLVGQKGYGIFQQLGGEVYVNTNHILSTSMLYMQNYTFMVGSGLAATNGLTNACFYACGGKLVVGNAFLIQGSLNNETGVMPASATIDGTAVVTSQTVRVGANTGDGTAVLNLNGGTLSTDLLRGYFLSANNASRLGASVVNADGGTISFPNVGMKPGLTTHDQFLNLDKINIYPGGLTVDCGQDVNLGTATQVAKLYTPGGRGIKSVTRGSRGNLPACNYPPRMEIYGGSGSNATVVALIDYDKQQMTNVVVTCRGEGYKRGDVVKARIIRANLSSNVVLPDSVDVSLSVNEPGALVKTGTGTLSLYAQPEFEGIYEVREGTMIQTTATNGSEKVSAIVVGGTDAVFQCGSANSTATVAKSNPINPSATLTLGTAYGPGTLAVPAAANGQSAAFEQTFASLTVSGTGNTIEMASGNTAANGAKVTFGDISCPDGAEVTIPNWKSSFKVYVTGRPARTVFKNVRFAGTDLHAAVGPDGQLIPAPGMTVSFR